MKTINRKTLNDFLGIAVRKLSGNWVLIGGSVIQIIKDDARVTLDIDIAGPDSATQSDTLMLMDIAAALGLPVEAINQTGAYFLRKISGWDKMLIEIRKGPKTVFYRPNVTLFLLLKIARLSETDLEDCFAFIDFARKNGETLNVKQIDRAIESELKTPQSEERLARLKSLRKAIL